MSYWTALWFVPLSYLSLAAFNLGTHWVQQASEQTRLDAVTLSLCHQRIDFIESELTPLNDQIEFIQGTMDALAATCLVPAPPVLCSSAVTSLRLSSKVAAGLTLSLEALRHTYPVRARNERLSLISDNQLAADSVQVERYVSILDDGFQKRPLNSFQKTAQAAFGVTWPQPLEPHSQFIQKNHYELHYTPERKILDAESGWKVRAKKSRPQSPTTSQSGCAVEDFDEGTRFEVKRLL
jgi:hypothetical protein